MIDAATGPVELGARRAARPAASRGPRGSPPGRPRRRRCESDLPELAGALARRLGHQLRRDADHALAARRAGTARASPRHAGSPQAPRPARRRRRGAQSQQLTERAAAAGRDRHARRASRPVVLIDRAASVCDRLWVSAPITIICHRPFDWSMPSNRSPAGRHLSRGDCHAPIKSRQGSSDGGGRHNQRRSDLRADSHGKESARRRPRTLPATPDTTRPTEPRLSLTWKAAGDGPFTGGGRHVVGSASCPWGGRSVPGATSCVPVR